MHSQTSCCQPLTVTHGVTVTVTAGPLLHKAPTHCRPPAVPPPPNSHVPQDMWKSSASMQAAHIVAVMATMSVPDTYNVRV